MHYLKLLFICFFPILGYSQGTNFTNNTFIADSLDNIGEYNESIKYRVLALQEKGHSQSYKSYVKAKWHYTKSCILETKGGIKNISEGLEHSKEAYRLVENIVSENDKKLFFRHLILNRIYHQYGYTGQWPETLTEAQKDYEVLRDTFPEHHIKILHILDDLGFIHNKLENPEKSNTYYERSYKLYKKYHPQELNEVFINNHRIISNYRKLGLKNEEFKLLEDSEDYWTNRYEGEEAFFQQFLIYGELANWHINYGNNELAESYLMKKEALFDSVADSRKKTEKNALVKRERVALNESYIKLYLKSKDYDKTKVLIDETHQLLKDSLVKYRWNVESKANLLLTESRLPDVEFYSAEHSIKKALTLIEKNKEKYFISPIPYQMELFNLYVDHNRKKPAFATMEVIIESEELTNHVRLQLLFKKAILLKDETQIKLAFLSLLKSPDPSLKLKKLVVDDLYEYYTFDILNNLLDIASIYLDWYHTSNDIEYFEIANNLYMLSSKFFERIYKGDAFNDNLYNRFIDIQDGLLKCALLKPSIKIFEKTLNAIENNSSRLTWSKFVYGKNAKLNVPDSLLLKEEKLQSLINYYQEQFYEKRNSETIDLDKLELRLTDLNNQLRKHQNYISKNYIQYSNSNINSFDVQDLKERLGSDEAAIKYIISKNDIFAFTITKSDTHLQKIIQSENISDTVSDFIDTVSTFDSKVVVPDILIKLTEPILESNKQSVVIVGSGKLNFIPFELLLPNYFDSNVALNYSGSLKLYKEQLNTNHINNALNVGIFKAQNGNKINEKGFLPDLDREIEGIKEVVDATDYFIKKREDFFMNVKPHNVLHFGVHTTIDEDMPELSALNFAESDVLIGSLYNTSLQADLAVLSACDTGNGNYVNGEGIQSISKAFTYAGVPSTLMSLWKVDDKATATIMGNFYKHLGDGKPKDLALKLAKKEYLDSDIDAELKHPYYWSGFVISGNPKPFIPQSNVKYWWLSILILPVIIWGFYRKSKFGK